MKTTNNTSSSLPTFGRTLSLLVKSTVLLTRTTLEAISVGHESVINGSKLANQIDTDSLKDIFQGRAESNEMSREYLKAGIDTITNIFSSDEEVKAKTKSAFDRAEVEVNTDEIYKGLATKLNYNGTQPFEAYLKASVLTEAQVSVLNKYVQMDYPIVDIITKIALSKEQLELIATQA